METTQIILFSAFGSILPDILRFIKIRDTKKIPDYLPTLMFWIGTFLLVCVGVFAGIVLKPTSIIEATAYGFSAPEILSKLFSKSTSEIPVSNDPLVITRASNSSNKFDLRKWWAL